MGSVGTGKSSLLSALIAELDKESGVIALSDCDKGERATSVEGAVWDSLFHQCPMFMYR
jgi:ABC-type transporter Mla maintaining outer membrane lipid asymmetry ATPase subunit MlaF